MKRILLLFVLVFSLKSAYSAIAVGDIAIILYNADNPDNIKFITFEDIAAGEVLKFTDNGWLNSGSFRSGEGTHTWTAPSGGVACGSVVDINLSNTALSGTGDQLIVYQGASTSPTMITAINSEGAGIWQANATNSNTSAIPTGLVNGTNAIALNEIDNAKYTGTLTGTKASLKAAIFNNTNWSGHNSTRQSFTGTFNITDCGTACTPPTTQPTSSSETSITSNGATINWLGGNGVNSLVVVKETSAVLASPANNTTYTPNTVFGTGDEISTDEEVVYASSGASVSVTGLSASTTYHYVIYEFDGAAGSECFQTTSPTTGSFTTPCPINPDNVTGFSTSNCETGGVTLNWVNPTASACWDNVLIFASETSCTSNTPSGNGAAYSPANTIYGMGDDDLETGVAYLVYKGTASSVTLTGLTNGQAYCFKIFTREGTTWSSGVETNCTPSIPIPDNACGINEVTQTINYSGTSTIDDINVSVSIEHTYRADINIEVESPIGTIVQLFDGSNSGGEDNLEAIFDDAGSVISSSAHTIDGIADETVTSDVDLLSSFNGELANGNWIIRVCDDAGGDLGNFINWNLDITESCTPTHTFASMTPENGPVGTDVTITGTGYTASTTATIDGVAATLEFVSSTSIKVEIPSNAESGSIVITESACDVSTTVFTVAGKANCTSAPTNWTGEVLISAIYDDASASCHYIELYNPTSTAINLNTYTLGSDNNTSNASGGVGAPPSSYNGGTHALSGSIPANSTFLILASSGGATCTTCSSLSPDFTLTNLGFNGGSTIDRLFLINGGTEIDLWANGEAHNNGYIYSRISTSTAPSLTYSNSDWDSDTNESCVGFTFDSTDPPTLTTISDITACDLDFQVTGTAGDGGTLTYKWFYTDGISTNWTEVTSTDPTGLTILGETSNNLTISSGASDVSTISGYQFYAKVFEDAACENVSNAAMFEFKPEPFFRTKGAGLSKGSWNDVSLWEMSTDLSTWSAACTYPTASNSDSIIIQPSDSIAVIEGIGAPDIIADQVYVAALGILLVDESAELNIENGATLADLVIDGVLIDKASSGSGNGVSFVNGGTWQLGINGTIVKTYTSSVNKYRDNYEGGISTIPATAHWAYVYTGQGDVSNASINMFYPNLYFESDAGAYDANGFNEIFKGVNGFTTVKGNLSIGLGTISQGTGPYKVYNNNKNAQPMLIMGNVFVGPGSEFTNVDVSAGTDNGTGIEVKGGFTIEGAMNMISGTGITKLSGTTKQEIISATGTGLLNTYEFELDNTANTEIDNIDINIANTLTFTNGKIITDVTSSDIVFVQNSSTSAIVGGNIAGTDKYVEGKLQWITDGASSYVFPVGHSSQNAQGFTIGVTGAPGSEILGYLEANSTNPTEAYAYCDLETHPGGGTVNAGSGNAGYDGVDDQIEFNLASPLQWDITNPGGGVTMYDLTVNANGGQDITPVTTANGLDVRFLLKNGEPGNTGVTTSVGSPSFSQTGFAVCPNGYALSNLNSFSKFTVNGATAASTTLPVELLYFDVANRDNEVRLNWATVTEINNDFFTLERSKNGQEFFEIGTIKGAGNYNGKLDYNFVDEKPFEGISYYRLKQTDFDGSFEHSDIKIINRSSQIFEIGNLYPNPVSENLIITVSTIENEIVNIKVFDLTGRIVSSKNLNVSSRINRIELNLKGLLSGIYTLNIETKTITKNINFVKE